jgi:multidrug efflux pump subunit AcrB
MRFLDAFVTNPIAANLLLVLIVAAGLLSLPSIRQETYPRSSLDVVTVTVTYPGTSPDEIEESICVRIEEAIDGVHGISRLRSTAQEGFAIVTAELAVGSDHSRILEEIRTRIDALDTMPAEAGRPIVEELIDQDVLLSIAVYGRVSERTLRRVGEQVRDDIAALPEVPRAELVSVRPYELTLEVSEMDLRRHGITFDDVVWAVRASSLDLPGGSLETRAGEILLRVKGQARRGPEFEDLVLLTSADGTRLRLGDVARVVDGFADVGDRARFDGKPAAIVRVMQRESEDHLAVSSAVRAWLPEAQKRMPRGVELAIWNDVSLQLRSSRDILLRSAAQGLVLVALILALFLRLRTAFWVTAGIPVAFLGALIVIGVADVSINMMSLFAFIVAIGLVVDDAIVIGESIARHQERAEDRLRASIEGMRAVALPVVTAVFTTVLFLAPVLWLPTPAGKLARALPIVVIACLVFSLIESLFVLPAHLAHRSPRSPGSDRPSAPRALQVLDRLQLRFAAGVERFTDGVFLPVFDRALRWPGIPLALGAVALMLSVAVVAGGRVGFRFFPETETDWVTAEIVLSAGTHEEKTWAALVHIEKQARVLRAQIDGTDHQGPSGVFDHVLSAVGDIPDDVDPATFVGGDAGNIGRVRLDLAPASRRTISSLDLEERWRALVGTISGAESLTFQGAEFAENPSIDIQLFGPDYAELERAGEAVKRHLVTYSGVREISDSMRGGKQELRLRLKPEGEASGLRLSELARQLRQGFHGEEVQRVQRGRAEVAVVVRYPARERRSLGDLDGMWIRTSGGRTVPLRAIATLEQGRGYTTLQRRDRRRVLNVRADLDPSLADLDAILADLTESALSRILADYSGVRFRLDGEKREQGEFLAELFRSFALALIAAYALLAVTLRSYVAPLLILLALPFGFVGALVGHVLFDMELSAFSMIGMLALSGVVINDALLLVESAQRKRAQGVSLNDAFRESVRTRFRPILLTSLTTFFGLLPLLLEPSAQAAWLKPMGVSIGVGVVFATAITLLLVPAACVTLGFPARSDLVAAPSSSLLSSPSVSSSPRARGPA